MEPLLFARYAELDCLSNFTFLTGASHPEELVQRAAQLGYEALALSDECSLAGVVRAHVEAKQHNIKLIIGSRFRLSLAGISCVQTDPIGPQHLHVIVLACNAKGYGDLSELITLARTRSEKGHYHLTLQDLLDPPAGMEYLNSLPDCLAIFRPEYGVSAPVLHEQISLLLPVFGHRLWLGLALHHGHADALHLSTLQQVARQSNVRLLATGQVEMHRRSRQPLHDTLAAIRLKKTVQQCGYDLTPNAEHHLRSRLRLINLYPASALEETLNVSRLCTFDLEQIKYTYPQEAVPPGHTAASYLRHETYIGVSRRYPGGASEKVINQIEAELAIITQLKYEPYFLTVYDIVQFARQQGILCQGRGSAANSAVCYCLGITEVDPESGNALFARFISRERNEPPDIDVDFEHQRREEVIQYIYKKYGRQRAALTAIVTSYRTRSVLRDTGKALGLDMDLIDRVAKSFQFSDGTKTLQEKMAENGLDPNSGVVRMWMALTQTLKDFPRHLSQHPGGFVISDQKLCRLVPIENAAMPERSVIQWDKNDLDALGILKVDVLGLGMLSALNRCLHFVALRRNQPFSMQNVPVHDTPTFEMIQRADTVGVFQIESRAQMSMLPRLKPAVFYDLVIQVAIVRPGPIQGKMVHPYLRRRQGEKFDYPSPALEKVLSRTLGVPIFQEQAMQVAMVAASFTGDEADQLRRSMAAWRRRGGVEKFHARLVDGMLKNGYTNEFAQGIYQQLQGFADYGFPESHSASFAKLAYISAWLKCHEPEAFLASLLNSQPMGFYSSSQLVQDAQRHGVTVLPVDIQHSGQEASLEEISPRLPRPAVRLGFNQVSGLSAHAALRIEAARQRQAFTSTQDLASRAELNRKDMDALAAANALSALAGHRRQARWEAASHIPKGLLRDAVLPDLDYPTLPAPSEGQDISADYQSLGLTLGRHPLALLRSALLERRFSSAATLTNDYPDRRLARACGIVTTRQRPQTANGTIFVTLEDETGNVNVIVRPELARRQTLELVQAKLLGVYGVWQRQSGVCHLMASRLVDLSSLLGQLKTQSRNFH